MHIFKDFCNILIETNRNHPQMFHRAFRPGGCGLGRAKKVVAAESSKENYDFDCINTDVNTNSGQIQFLLQTNFKTVPPGLNSRPGTRAKGWWQQRAARKTMHQVKYEKCEKEVVGMISGILRM